MRVSEFAAQYNINETRPHFHPGHGSRRVPLLACPAVRIVRGVCSLQQPVLKDDWASLTFAFIHTASRVANPTSLHTAGQASSGTRALAREERHNGPWQRPCAAELIRHGLSGHVLSKRSSAEIRNVENALAIHPRLDQSLLFQVL
jgi:hypothetical protein